MKLKLFAVTALMTSCGMGTAQVTAVATRPVAVDNVGVRNDAFREAETKFGVPREFLMALAYQQGRFESASPDQLAPRAHVVSDDPELTGDEHDGIHHFGPMFLSLEQVASGAARTGLSEESIRLEAGANIVAGSALLAADTKPIITDQDWETMAPFRKAITGYLVLADAPAAAELAISEVHAILRSGFSVELADGEKLEVRGFGPELATTQHALGVGE